MRHGEVVDQRNTLGVGSTIVVDRAPIPESVASHLMPFLLAGLASVSFGVADFLGGLATQRVRAASVVVTSQLVGGAAILLAAILLPGEIAGPAEFAWGAAAGIAGGFGLVLLYHALATTRMSVTAPVTAFFGTASPVLFGLAIGERPAPGAGVGVALGLVSIVLIAWTPDRSALGDGGSARSVVYGAVAGIAFGLFGILISRTGTAAGLWPLVGARGASIVLVGLIAVAAGRPIVAPEARPLVVGAGLLDMAANVMFLVAVRRELLSLISVIMAMYPASTVGLARWRLGEAIAPLQLVGLVTGAVAIGLIALG